MWRFILLGVVAVSADDRWSRQSTDRRQGDWIPVAAPSVSFHKGRSIDQNVAATGGLPSVLTPPIQQHPRLLPPPPPDGLFQQAATSGFLNNFSGQQSLIDTKPRQFLPPPNINNQQSPFRFKDNSQLSDSAGIPSNLFQVGPQQFTQNPTQTNSQLLSSPPFLPPPQFIPPPQRTPLQQFVQFNPPQILQQNIPFPEFQLQSDQPAFLPQPGLPPQQPVLFNQLTSSAGHSSGRFAPNITSDFKQESQNQGKEEVQLLYVPVETLRQRGRNFANVRGNKKVELNNSNQNSFAQLNQQGLPNIQTQTSKPFFRSQSNENDQFFKQSSDLQSFQSNNPQLHHVIQETTAPQIQYKQTPLPQVLQEHTTYAQDSRSQQTETVTPSSTTTNTNKYVQSQHDELPGFVNQQYTLDQYQQLNQESVTPGKLGNSNQNYYQTQQYSGLYNINNNNNNNNNNNEEVYHHSTSPEDQQTVPPPHQPPLSVYMETNANSKIADVLTHLKNAKTIPVLDTIGPDSPQVFVGPSNLHPPSGYLKFELPYLSSLDTNRVERKVDKLPFFVAPLNFQPPPGYSKIPFPAPHIGSVVVSNITILKTALHEKPDEYLGKPETSTPSGIQQYSVAADISPFSPQLPSLVNSLQEERYFPSPATTTTEIPTVTPSQTTQIYTTPYRRTPGRGSHRLYTTTTEGTPTRRPATRQRRPQSGRQSYRASQIVSTTTPEPTLATTSHHYDQSEEQQNSYSDIITESPQLYKNQNLRDPVYENSNQNNKQFSSQNNQQIYKQQQSDEQYNQNYQQSQQNLNNILHSQGIVPQLEQVQQYFTQVQQQQYLQGNHQPQKPIEQTTQNQNLNYNPDNVTPQNSYQDQYNNNNNNNNNYYSPSGPVSDTPQQQTTEAEIQKVSPYVPERTTVNSNRVNNVRRDPLRQRFRGRNSYQTTTEHITTTERERVPQRIKSRPSHTQNIQIVKDNYPENYPTNTERIDDQSTERNEEINYNNYNDFRQLNAQNQQPVYQHEPLTVNDNEQFYQQQQYNEDHQNVPSRQNKPEQHYNSEENIPIQIENSTPQFTDSRETTQLSNINLHNSQQSFVDTSAKYEDNSHLTERPINQQRLTKYTRVRGRLNQGQQREQQIHEQNVPHYSQHDVEEKQQHTFESSSPLLDHSDISGVTELEPEQITTTTTTTTTTTPKPSVVRVRGRVRNRQRGSSARQTTTTEPPNYPVESGLISNPDSQYVRRPASHRKAYPERISNYNRHSANRFRNSNSQSHYNSNENVENDSIDNPSSTTSTAEDSGSTTTETIPVSRKYNHILNRNIARRPNNNRYPHQTTGTTVTTESTPQSDGETTTKYLIRTTRRPVTQVTKLQDGRSRIRRPSKAALTSTTEQTPLNNAEEHFAPSAASNEVLDPYYPSQANYNDHNGNQNLHYNVPNRSPIKQYTPSYESSTILTPTPFAPANSPSNADEYWNQGFTIQQSNSYDFSAESSPATQSTLSSHYNDDEDFDDDSDANYSHRSTSSWHSPSRSTTHNQDQTPYSSNEQYVAAVQNSKVKSKPSAYGTEGKENQWNEKSNEDQEQGVQEEQPGAQFDGESFNRHYDYDGQYNKEVHSKEEIPENRRPVYIQTEEKSEDTNDKTETSSQIEPQLAFTAPEDIIRTKDGFIQRKAVDPVTGKKSGRRRGAWVRVRVHKKPKDVFETAESQNLASLSNNNAIKSSEGKSDVIIREYSIPPNHRPTDPYSTDVPQTTVSQTTTTELPTTTQPEENFQKSLTDMIREIIKEEENEEEIKEIASNNTITTTILPFVLDEATENQQITTTVINEGAAVTITPETITQPSSIETEGVTTIKEEEQNEKETTTVEPRILGTSTTTEISLETEICYRGRCVKSKKNKKPVKHILAAPTPPDSESDLMPVE